MQIRYHHQQISSVDGYRVVDCENTFWGILDNVDISKCSLYHHKFVAICKSRFSNNILLYKDSCGLFDFAVFGTACYGKSIERCIDEQAKMRLGEKPLAINCIDTLNPKDSGSSFISCYEIYYTEKIIKNVICGENLLLLDIEEFQNLCAYFPKDVSPLLRETAHSVFRLFPSRN